MDPSFHSRKQLAWGMLLFMAGFIGASGGSMLCFLGWVLSKCSDTQQATVITALFGMLFFLQMQALVARKPEDLQKWTKPFRKKPFLPFLTIGLWGFAVVVLTVPIESWFRYAFVLLIYIPVVMGVSIKAIDKSAKEHKRHPIEDTEEYRSMKRTIDALPDWLFAKDMLGKSLHVRLSDGTTSCIIEADYPIPTSIKKPYAVDSNKEAMLELYWLEDYSRKPVADYRISKIPTGTDGKSKFEVIFKINSQKELTCAVARPLKIERIDCASERSFA